MSEQHSFKSIAPHIVRGALWMVGMRWVLRLIGLVNIVILARLLTPEDFGIVAMATVVVGFLQMFADVNVDLVLLRNTQAGRPHYDTAWTVQAGLGLGITVLLFALAPGLAHYYGDDRVTLVIQIISLKAGIIGFENIGVVDFRKNLQFDKEFKFWVFSRIFTFSLTLVLALTLRSYMALAIVQPLAALTAVVLSYLMSPYRPRFSLARIAEIWSFSQWLVLYNTAKFVNSRVDEFIVGGFATPKVLGHYFIAADISTMPIRELAQPISRALMPTYAKLSHDPAELRSAFTTVLGFLAIVCFAAGAGVAAIAEDLVLVVLGQQWRPAIPFFAWFALYGVFEGLVNSLLPYFLVQGRERLYALATTAQAGLLIAVLLPLGYGFGVMAVAIGRTAVMIVVAVAIFGLVTRLTPISGRAIIAALWRPALAGLIMLGSVIGLHAEGIETRAVTLALDIGTGAIVFTAALLILWRLAGRPAGPEATLLNIVRARLGW